ncbi:MAG TPA: biotin--[acetyl-CoA-carboxylase] ligase [Dissulfurispiraceae bacterium]|nr:biotin--[acetyl-CoA-carboxylase] ligase [Dissulfurispiraceae bacterium]
MTDQLRQTEVLRIFRGTSTYISGAKIAQTLGITRSAVWKIISRLRAMGYEFESLPAKGYRLLTLPEFSSEEVRHSLIGLHLFMPENIHFYQSLESTNITATEFAAHGAPSGTIVVAEQQVAGRGRLTRVWESPPGVNIYMSVLLRPDLALREITILTLLAGVACASALRGCCDCTVHLKWPNDLLVGKRKLGGILTELRADPDRVQFAVIGIGINVNMRKRDMPPSIRMVATSVSQETGQAVSRSAILSAVMHQFDKWLLILAQHGKRPILDEWQSLSSTIGKTVTIASSNRSLTGVAEGIDDDGFLIVRLPNGTLTQVHAGDVNHV